MKEYEEAATDTGVTEADKSVQFRGVKCEKKRERRERKGEEEVKITYLSDIPI